MGKYNSGMYYNKKGPDGGLIYNYGEIVIYVSVSEIAKIAESVRLSARSTKREQIAVNDTINLVGTPKLDDYFHSDDTDDILLKGLIPIIENIEIQDAVIDVLNMLGVKDTAKMVDEAILFYNALQAEEISLSDTTTIENIAELADSFGLSDLSDLISHLSVPDNFWALDKNPRMAISDFYIGEDTDYNNGYRWLQPFNLMVHEPDTQIQVMPSSESDYIDVPGVDGSIIQNTVYKNRFFTIVGYSLQGMTQAQKDNLQQEICEVLDSTKDGYKKLTNQRTETTFNVKYSGQAEFSEAPTWLKASIPLEVKPYGQKLFPIEIEGDGLIVNDGDKELGIIVTISSGCVNPYFRIGTYEYLWSGTVPSNNSLVVDFEDTTCYLVDAFGVKYNALDKLTKAKWITVPKKTSMAFTCMNTSTKEHSKVEYSPFVLWKKL